MRQSDLIIKYYKNKLTGADKKEFEDWLNLSESNRLFLPPDFSTGIYKRKIATPTKGE